MGNAENRNESSLWHQYIGFDPKDFGKFISENTYSIYALFAITIASPTLLLLCQASKLFRGLKIFRKLLVIFMLISIITWPGRSYSSSWATRTEIRTGLRHVPIPGIDPRTSLGSINQQCTPSTYRTKVGGAYADRERDYKICPRTPRPPIHLLFPSRQATTRMEHTGTRGQPEKQQTLLYGECRYDLPLADFMWTLIDKDFFNDVECLEEFFSQK